MLTTAEHRRDSAGMTYIYPVVSRRAGGVSVGVNLNVNNACNWACVYCQVENLQRGGPPPIDLGLLEQELDGFLAGAPAFLASAVAPEARRIVDVAFSGNGEPTSAAEFPQAVGIVRRALERHGLAQSVVIRLITNGSLLHRPAVRRGIAAIGEAGGEVWFKVDRVGPQAAAINGVPQDAGRVLKHLLACAALARTWVQTCWFALDGAAPGPAERQAYCDLIGQARQAIAGIHLYGLARPSLQPAAPRLQRLEAAELEAFAAEIEKKTGVRAVVSP